MIEQPWFPGQGRGRCNAVFGLRAVGEPVIEPKNSVADFEIFNTVAERFHHAGKFVA